jgi:hypothetical protein
MFCPKCLYEYEKGITKCPDCGSLLVEEDPAKEDEGDLPDIRVAEAADVDDDLEAGALRSMLDAEGIHSFLRVNVLPHTNIVLGFFRKKSYGTIIVNREELEKAKKVVEDFRKL